MSQPYQIGFAIEQNMGHVAYSRKLQLFLQDETTIQPHWLLIPLDHNDPYQKIPNLSLRLSLRTRREVNKLRKHNQLDCLFIQTQLMSLFSLSIMKTVPTIISLDATPLNFVDVADSYGSKSPTGLLSQFKYSWYHNIFKRAKGLLAWSHWAEKSLIQDYHINPEKIRVIRPGIDIKKWQPISSSRNPDQPLKLLFIGADFERKGGKVLLTAFRQGLKDSCELHILTKDPTVTPEAGVILHQNIKPNSPELRQLYAEADLFVFPTLGDVTPIAILEAMALGLPVITTDVGAVAEEVEDGVSGFLVPINDPNAIIKAVSTLVQDPAQLQTMGKAARARIEKDFNAETNFQEILDFLKDCMI